MSNKSFHVLIVGGGIGGLCLAQGLKRAGVSVAVYERDRTRTDRLQGYRIHISPAGSRALHECLAPELFDAFVATTGKGGGFSFLTERMRTLLHISPDDITGGAVPDPVSAHHSVSRITLRQVLLAGLDDVVHFDKKFVRYEQRPDGTVTAYFEDGSEATGEVLVAADGGRSRVRQQYLPHAEQVDTGIAGIAGKLPLTDETRPLLPEPLRSGAAFVAGAPGGHAMFLAVQEFDRQRIPVPARGIGADDAAAAEQPGLLFDNTSDYLMWGFTTQRHRYPAGDQLETLDNAALQQVALRMIDGWHPDLRRLVAESDPATIAVLPIHTATPVEAWPTSTITLLGDAIHSMTPFQGIGANTALRDAALLCHHLVAAHRGDLPLLRAIGEYENQMRDYGFDAVLRSLTTARQATSDSAVSRFAGRTFFRLVDRVPSMKRRFLADV
jgi:2-polyprenyl-6-methoxyphenol hydroxylase-like FAD-dependent oxidoreductase